MQSSRHFRNHLELALARSVGAYIHAHSHDAPNAQEMLRSACARLEYLLGSLLQERADWSGWVDGILPASDLVTDAVQVGAFDLTIRGHAIWVEHAAGCWVEPFLASVQITDTHDALAGYEICFADAARGLAQHPYGKRVRRADWYFPAEWLITFSSTG